MGSHWSELLARRHLEAAGLVFVAANHRERRGEIDLVMRDGPTLVFVEVRHRAGDSHGSAGESLDARKLGRLRRTAELYLLRTLGTTAVDCRFDAVLVSGPRGQCRIEHVPAIDV